MAWLADIGNGKKPPEPKPQQTSKPANPQEAMPSFTFKPSVLRIEKTAEPSAPRKKNPMQEALDFLAQESAKIQAEEAAEKAAAEREEIAREETLRLEAEQQTREKIARERAEQNRREQQEREERERNKKKFRGMDK